MGKDTVVEGSRFLKAVEVVAISPDDAKDLVRKYEAQVRKGDRRASDRDVQELVADKIVSRFTWLSTTTGGLSALPGVIPGLGTAAVVGTALGDAVLCMKFQVDMCMCLAEAFGYDINSEDAKHLCFLIAAGGALEKVFHSRKPPLKCVALRSGSTAVVCYGLRRTHACRAWSKAKPGSARGTRRSGFCRKQPSAPS